MYLSAPVLAHSSSPVPGSNTHWNHTTVLAISTNEVTESKLHNFNQSDKQIYRRLYSDFLKCLNEIRGQYQTDPTKALQTLQSLQVELNTLIQ